MIEELRQRLAAIEHERWADWQRYLHSHCRRPGELEPGIGPLDRGCLVIPTRSVEQWERQIATPYKDLTAAEQRSDMEQVDRYWPLIKEVVELGEYLHYEGTSAGEVLGQLRAGTYVLAHRDDVTYEDPMGSGR